MSGLLFLLPWGGSLWLAFKDRTITAEGAEGGAEFAERALSWGSGEAPAASTPCLRPSALGNRQPGCNPLKSKFARVVNGGKIVGNVAY